MTRTRRSRRRKRSSENFPENFDAAYQAGLRSKIGLFTARDGDEALVQDLLDAMAKNQADFTLTFRRLGDAAQDPADDSEVRHCSPIPQPSTIGRRAGASASPMSRNRPPSGRPRCARSIPPSFRATTAIEAVIEAAVNHDDFAPFEELLTVLAKPFEDQPGFSAYADPPSRTSAYCRRSAGREPLTVYFAICRTGNAPARN